MAGGTYYRDLIIKTKLKKVTDLDGSRLVLDLPFKTYGRNIISNGKDVTFRLNDLKLEGAECIAKVDYAIADEKDVLKFAGIIASKYEDEPTKNADYLKHYSVTKAEKLATYTALDEKVLYDGADKDEVVPFCLALVFKKPVVEEDEISIIGVK